MTNTEPLGTNIGRVRTDIDYVNDQHGACKVQYRLVVTKILTARANNGPAWKSLGCLRPVMRFIDYQYGACRSQLWHVGDVSFVRINM